MGEGKYVELLKSILLIRWNIYYFKGFYLLIKIKLEKKIITQKGCLYILF